MRRLIYPPLMVGASALSLLAWAALAPANELPGLDCVITPYAMVDVASAVPGVLEAVHVDRSDRVEEGQVVAQLDSGVERASVALAQARASMDTEINLQGTNLAFHERERERLSSLYAKKVASFHDKDKAERDAAVSRWKVRQARDLYRLRQLELRKAQEVLSQKTVTTPISGVVVQRHRSPGEYVEDQPILQIAQLHPLNVEAIVPMALFGQIREGMQGEVMPETVSEGTYRATVTVVDGMGNAASGTFGVRLELPNLDYRLPAGQKCSVRFLPDAQPVPATTDEPKAAPLPSMTVSEDSWDIATPATVVLAEAPPLETAAAPAEVSSETTGATALAPVRACRTVGPLTTLVKAERLSLLLRDHGFQVSRREDTKSAGAGYLVLTPPQETPGAVRRLAARLGESGIQDLQIMGRGAYKGRLSLGVFKDRKGAERRRDELAALGFETEPPEPISARRRWWLDLAATPTDSDEGSLRELIDGITRGLEIKSLACASILTAEHWGV